jgi:DAACS family dicarboxylate/amino acid:cation (Na+ or H+) symporter
MGTRRIPLPVQMLIGLAIGCAVSALWPGFAKQLLPVAQTFVKALRMLVIPLVFTSITLGVYQMGREMKLLGRMIVIAFVWFYTATGGCFVLGLTMNAILHPGIGADLSALGAVPANAGMKIDWVQFLTDLVPVNIVGAMADQKVLPVLLFGILFGAALSTLDGAEQPVTAVLRGVQLAVMRMVRWIVSLAPLAVAAVMAWLFATQGGRTLYALAQLIGSIYLALAIVVVVMMLVIRAVGENPFGIVRKIAEPLILAFTTRSSEVTLPIHMEILERSGIPNKVVSTVIPLGYAFNQDGSSVYVAMAVAFVAEANHLQLGLAEYATIFVTGLIATKGMGNVSGGGLVAATTVLVAMGLPVESVALIAGIDVFMDMGRTAVNVLGNTVAVLLVRRFGRVAAEEPPTWPAPVPVLSTGTGPIMTADSIPD